MKKPKRNNAYHALRSLILLVSILYMPHAGQAQLIKSVSFPEAMWALTHPFKLPKALKATKRTIFITDSLSQLDSLNTLGDHTADAFMHCLWLTMLTIEIDSSAAMKLAMAHEKGNVREWKRGSHRHDSTSRRMDIMNNYVGIQCGRECSNKNEKEIILHVLHKVKSGQLQIIARDEEGDFIDSKGDKITWPPRELQWYSRRVLCPSNS